MASITIKSSSYEGRVFRLVVSQDGTSSKVDWTFTVEGGSSSYYTASPIEVVINDVTVLEIAGITYWNNYAFPAAKGSRSGSLDIGEYKEIEITLSGRPFYYDAVDYTGKLDLVKPTYTISYNANGGINAPNPQTKDYGVNLTLSSAKPTRVGYTFLKWNTKADGSGTSYNAGASYAGNSNVVLYAIWQINTYAVSYDANGGSGAPATQTKTHGVDLTLSATKPTRENYNFLGWATENNATSPAYNAGDRYIGNEAVKLYAVWQLAYVKPRITNFTVTRCDANGVESEDGTYYILSFDWETDNPVSSIKVAIKKSTATSYGGMSTLTGSGTSGTYTGVRGEGTITTDISFNVKITVTDSQGSSSEIRTIPGIGFPIDCKAGGKGVSIGKPAEKEGFEVDWDSFFNKGLKTGNVELDVTEAEINEINTSLGTSGVKRLVTHIKSMAYKLGLIADYVMEEGYAGTNNVWRYKKWASGDLELWRLQAFNANSTWTAIGSDYYHKVSAYLFPTNIPFIEAPKQFIKISTSNASGWEMVTSPTATQTGTIYVIRPAAGANTSCIVHFYIIGKWK